MISGLISSTFYLTLGLLQNYIHYQYYNNDLNKLWYIIITLHIISWIAQFIGHGVFEKRAPALLDNLFLTLVAPNFVILEIMF